MIEQLNGTLEQVTDLLGKLYGIPGYVLVFISCIVVGYVFRVVKTFPNSAIPYVAILWGPVFNMVIADPNADDLPIRIWLVKNFLVGFIIAGGAWAFHNKLLKRVEDKIPFLKGWLVPDDDTGSWNKQDFADGQPTNPTK